MLLDNERRKRKRINRGRHNVDSLISREKQRKRKLMNHERFGRGRIDLAPGYLGPLTNATCVTSLLSSLVRALHHSCVTAKRAAL